MQDDLRKIGLTFNETKVYLSLLKIGETPVGGLIDDLKIHRQIAYNALDSLEKRGLVVKTVRNKINHFKINDPKIIVENIQKQEMIVIRLSKNIEKEMKKSRKEHEINVIEGESQVRLSLLKNVKKMEKGETFYIISGSVKNFIQTIGNDFFVKKFEKTRQQKNILSKMVAGKNIRIERDELKKMTDSNIRDDRYLPWDNTSPLNIVLWNGSVCFYSYNPDNQFGIEIKNDFLYNSYLEHFNALWKIAKK